MDEQEKAFKKMCIKQSLYPNGLNGMNPIEREAAERRINDEFKKNENLQSIKDGLTRFNY